MKRVPSMFRLVAPILLLMTVGACTSEEEAICKRELQFPDMKAMAALGKPEPEAESLKKCVELFGFMKTKLELDDAGYAEFVRCRQGTKSLNDVMDCTAKASFKSVEGKMDEVLKNAEKKAAEAKAAEVK